MENPKSISFDEISPNLKYFLYFVSLVALTIFFYFLPVAFGFDWYIIRNGIIRLFTGQEIYLMEHVDNGEELIHSAVFAPPWILIMLGPLAALPQKLGWALINSSSIFALIYVCHRYQIGKWATLLLVFSPPMIYNGVHGNLDALLLLLLFAPIELVPLVALSKPQVLFGIVFKFLHEKPAVWLRAALVTAPVLLLSLLIWGLWPLKILELAREQFSGPVPHSPLFELWPLQLLLAFGLIVVGYGRKDPRFYIAASPFMSSYATTGSFLGVLLMLCAGLKQWQSVAIIVAWWFITYLNNIIA